MDDVPPRTRRNSFLSQQSPPRFGGFDKNQPDRAPPAIHHTPYIVF